MKMKTNRGFAAMLIGTTALIVPAIAAAQSTDTTPASTTVQEVVVTGSVIGHKNATSISPLTVNTAIQLENRGVTTVQSAIQNLSNNGSGALPNSFTANGAFAAGASGASLRGLTTNSTLTLIDGMRAAYYPLADDGARNFVDLNTIPDVIVDRVEVLKDGGSSTYGADAIAGVINIITKKQYQGLTVKAEGGGAQHGGAGETMLSAIGGKGDLKSDGYNFYIGGEYEHDDALFNRQRGFPYNTANLSSICAPSLATPGTTTCRTNSIVEGIQFNGKLASTTPGSTIVAIARPYNSTNTTPMGAWQLLNPGLGCGRLTPITITASESSSAALIGQTLCQQDLTHDYAQIAPDDKRFSLSGRFTVDFGDHAQLYAEGNFYQNTVTYGGRNPMSIQAGTPPAASGTTTTNAGIALPVYVCSTWTNSTPCAAIPANLNPNNPFAALGEVARINYRFGDIPRWNEDLSRTYRFASGLNGDFGDGWKYDIQGTAMQTDLRATEKGVLFLSHVIDVVNTGAYNFMNPSLNSAAVRNFVAPTSVQNSHSKLWMLDANLSKAIFDLPGGPLTAAVGISTRYESINDPSANPDAVPATDLTDRYATDINPFGAIGSRTVNSAYYQIEAPFYSWLNVNTSGRYDSYSSGQKNFSPKVEAEIKPDDMFKLRGTYSKGFRIPSFAEANALPTTGYVPVSAPAAFDAAHGNDGYAQYSLGLTTVGTAGLKPEKSTDISVGVVFEPTKMVSFSVDYFDIKKTQVIAPADYTPAFNAYYAGTPIPAGYQVIADAVDPSFPLAMPRLAFIKYGYANLNNQFTDGFDFAATANVPLGWAKWTSVLDATYVQFYDLTFPDGTKQHYAGTLGPYQTTSASGTPRWRANWQNTLDFGKAIVSATIYYTEGYSETAEDNGDTANQCGPGATPTLYRDNLTPALCHTADFWDLDMHGSYQVTKHLQIYADVFNVLDTKAPYDPATYGGYQYNPAWANAGIIGRYGKIGLKATF